MNLNVNILLILLSYECFITYASEFNTSKHQQDEPNKKARKVFEKYTVDYLTSLNRTDFLDCQLWVPFQDYNMPIPITANTSNPKIILPNVNGNLIVKHHQYITLSCPGTFFVSPQYNRKLNEISVKCLQKTLVEYNNRRYKFGQFMCNEIPRPNLRVTNITCQNSSDNKILEVGFQTKISNIKFYRICYNVKYINPVYVWYNLKLPYEKRRQISKFRPEFIRTKLYPNVNINSRYANQRKTIAKILQSTEVTDYYIRRYDKEHFLARGHLMARTEFNYAFQQSATFFYENTTPQWQIFNDGVWKDIEKLFKRNMFEGNTKRVIVTGTYGLCTLQDRYEVEQPLYLVLPKSLAVPLYLWKLDYDLEKKDGIVFVGMNNPYKEIDESVYICKIVDCPGTMVQQAKTITLFYCCDLASFENTYGKLDSVIYEWI